MTVISGGIPMTLTWERDIVIRNENETLVDAVVRLLLSGNAINGKFIADETAAIMLIHHPDIEDIVGQVPEYESGGENTWTTAKYDAQRLHRCRVGVGANVDGELHCVEVESGSFILIDGSRGTPVNYCPFCGLMAKQKEWDVTTDIWSPRNV